MKKTASSSKRRTQRQSNHTLIRKKANFILHPKQEKLDASIVRHSQTRFAQSVELIKQFGFEKYSFFHAGITHEGGGVISLLQKTFYPHYKSNRSKRKYKSVNVQGSTSVKGKTIDGQLGKWTALGGGGKRPKRLNAWAGALMEHLETLGHTPQAAQLPVLIPNSRPHRMTQADLITVDGFGRLWLWEIKSGIPVGGFQKQDVFQNGIQDTKGKTVPCTKYGIWQLQLEFTRKALEAAGISIAEARVIQVYGDKRENKPVVKVHSQPEWVKSAQLK